MTTSFWRQKTLQKEPQVRNNSFLCPTSGNVYQHESVVKQHVKQASPTQRNHQGEEKIALLYYKWKKF